MQIDITKNNVVLWAFCEAIGKERNLIKTVQDNSSTENPKSYDVVFTVNGVELDFERVLNQLLSCYNKDVENKAKKLLTQKYENLISEMEEITDRINSQSKLFPYDWENEGEINNV